MVRKKKAILTLERDWAVLDLDKQIVDIVWGQADRAIYCKITFIVRAINGTIREQLNEQT